MDPFDTFGIEPAFTLDLVALEQRYRDLSRVVHPDKHAGSGAGDRRRALSKAIDVNAAWRVLRDPVKRAEALLAKRGVSVDERSQPKASPALLMDMMEQREELSEAKARGDRGKVTELAAAISAREGQTIARLDAGFSAAELDRDGVLSVLGELRYLRRFLDEVRLIEETL